MYGEDKKKYTRTIHRLVAIHFVENDNPDEKIQIDHLDCNKKNNRADNLEWVTPKTNTQRAYSKGLIPHASSDKDYCKKKVKCIETGKVFNSVKEAAESVKIAPTNMSQTCIHKRTARGYHFEFYIE